MIMIEYKLLGSYMKKGRAGGGQGLILDQCFFNTVNEQSEIKYRIFLMTFLNLINHKNESI